ncbi:hypothetical protein ACFC26_21700, partial [Kitasatospora purpeofusca]|uniref:hypothetical protein n=1 Tax=Kitasatospora purpeofusca TaxID=67352 RepID=UPI0035E3509F
QLARLTIEAGPLIALALTSLPAGTTGPGTYTFDYNLDGITVTASPEITRSLPEGIARITSVFMEYGWGHVTDDTHPVSTVRLIYFDQT